MAERTRGEVFAALVETVLVEERELKNSLVQRATNVITSAGVLVTLSLGLGTLVPRASTAEVPRAAITCFGVAVVLLFGSALLALLATSPRRQDGLDVDALRRRRYQPSDWTSVDGSEYEVFALRMELAAASSAANQRRARHLTAAYALELVALAALATTAVLIAVPAL